MKKIILSAFMLTGMLTFAQDGKLTVSGTVDVYATTNFDNSVKAAPGLPLDTNDSSVDSEGINLGMANVVFAYEAGKSGVVADLAFGTRANAVTTLKSETTQAINQLYAYYNVNDKLTLTAGHFNTFLGYEVISPASNFNYSYSYLFNAGPFTHTGAKLDYAASEDLSFMLAITNPHADAIAGSVAGHYQIGGQVGYKGQFLNLVYGAVEDGMGLPTDNIFIDYTGGFDINETFYLGINAAHSSSKEGNYGYTGIALYLEKEFNDTFSLGLRPEYFEDKGLNDAFALTLAANKKFTENLKVVAELRYDDEEVNYVNIDNAGGTQDTNTALTLAAVYSF